MTHRVGPDNGWKEHRIRRGHRFIAVRDFGGAGRAALLIHGLGQNRCAWKGVGPLLSAHLRTVAIDLPGHGGSTDGPITWESLADDVIAAADALRLAEPILIGHSLGAQIAQFVVAFRRSAPAVICLDNAVGDRSRREEKRVGWNWVEIERRLRDDAGRLPMTPSELASRVAQLRAEHSGAYGDVLGSVLMCSMGSAGDGLLMARPSVADTLAFLRLIAVRPPASAIYTKSECPTLLLFGSRSHWEKSRLGRAETVEVRRTRLERLAARYANLTLKWLPAGHNLHIQQPTQISAAIIAYLRLVGRLGASSKPDRKQAAR